MPEQAVDVLRRLLPDRDLRTVDDGWRAPVWRIEDLAEGFAGAANGHPAESVVVVAGSS